MHTACLVPSWVSPGKTIATCGPCSWLGGCVWLLRGLRKWHPQNGGLVLGLGSSCPPLKGTIKRLSSRKWFFPPLLSRTAVCLGPRGKTFPLLPSPWQEIYSERMLIILFSTYFLYIILIPLFLIILPIWFGSLGTRRWEQTKAPTVLGLYLHTWLQDDSFGGGAGGPELICTAGRWPGLAGFRACRTGRHSCRLWDIGPPCLLWLSWYLAPGTLPGQGKATRLHPSSLHIIPWWTFHPTGSLHWSHWGTAHSQPFLRDRDAAPAQGPRWTEGWSIQRRLADLRHGPRPTRFSLFWPFELGH